MSILDSSQRLAGKAFQMRSLRNVQSRELARFDSRLPGTRDVVVIRSRQGTSPIALGGRFGTHGQARGHHYAAPEPVGGTLKRCFDFAVALSAIIIMAPIMIVLALLILATMGRPIVFVQQRMGFGGKPFRCIKFRTMVPDAQERLARYLAENAEAAQLWRDTQKLKHDPRITWLGQVLRKSSLDELPQLFNILRGDMSCVGPRPVLASELQRYGLHAEDYSRAKPGLTGVWQVSGRSSTTYAHRVNCDRFYVRRWSAALDLWIMLRTIPAVLRFEETA
jgi:exopolysaccharide production protein ExoY